MDLTSYAVLRVFVAAIQALPLSACESAARALAWLAGDVLRLRGRLVESNLRIAFPAASDAQRRRIARRMWRHLFLMVAEIAHTPRKIHRTTWRSWCTLTGEEAVVRRVLDHRPVVLISGHFGNFELGGYLLGLLGFPTHTVARPIDNPFVDRFVNRFRGKTGQHILPKQGSQADVERLMQRGGALTLLGDQAALHRGCWVDFFGKPASNHKAISLFTLSFSAPTLVIGVRRTGGPLEYQIATRAVVDPLEAGFAYPTTPLLTQWFTHELEAIIREAPEQYWWVHNRWKGVPPQRRSSKPAAPHTAVGATDDSVPHA
ncbi:lysophospholipid acyltransferase family protein [Botrimarina hoheduenensis]|uniref:lysophospholipid acyltransferase family protein n=1 Tax=Botrimarina hoheduenensis TaxID=2528000 RepID=UPI0011B5A3D1|nr:lysophospholipid acyltransferase family protein [Botrimarina hoheduenensis]